MTKSQSKAEDERREAEGQSAVNKKHGGKVVEAITPDELVSVHDSDCKHPKLVRDPTETDFNAFVCSNPNCGEVFLYDKQ